MVTMMDKLKEWIKQHKIFKSIIKTKEFITMWKKYFLPLIIAISVLVLGIMLNSNQASFKAFQPSEVLQLLAGIFLIALFMERALEVFITTWRGPEAAQNDLSLKKSKDRIIKLEKMGNVQADKIQKKLKTERDSLENARVKRARYKSQTQRIALWTSLIFGLLISAIGFRALQSIVDIEAWKGIIGNQLKAFYFVDILLTGGLIAGGSDGIHKLMQIYSTFMDASNEKRKGAD